MSVKAVSQLKNQQDYPNHNGDTQRVALIEYMQNHFLLIYQHVQAEEAEIYVKEELYVEGEAIAEIKY